MTICFFYLEQKKWLNTFAEPLSILKQSISFIRFSTSISRHLNS